MMKSMIFAAGIGVLVAAGCATGPDSRSGWEKDMPVKQSGRSNAMMIDRSGAGTASAVPSGGALVDLRDPSEREEEDEIVRLEPWAATALGLEKTEWKRAELRKELKSLGLQEVDANGNPVGN